MLNLIKPPRFATNPLQELKHNNEKWTQTILLVHQEKKVEAKLNIDCVTPYQCLRWLQAFVCVTASVLL